MAALTSENIAPAELTEMQEYNVLPFVDDLRHGRDELVDAMERADHEAEEHIAQIPSNEVGALRRATYALAGPNAAFASMETRGEGEALKQALTRAVNTRHSGATIPDSALDLVSILARRRDNAELVERIVAGQAAGSTGTPLDRLGINLATARGMLGREIQALTETPDVYLMARVAPFAAAAGIGEDFPTDIARERAYEYLSRQHARLAIDLETMRRTADIRPLLAVPTFDPENGWSMDAPMPLGFVEAQKRAVELQQARRRAAEAERQAIRARLEADPNERISVIGRAIRVGWDPRSVPPKSYTAGNGHAYLDTTDQALAAAYYIRGRQQA